MDYKYTDGFLSTEKIKWKKKNEKPIKMLSNKQIPTESLDQTTELIPLLQNFAITKNKYSYIRKIIQLCENISSDLGDVFEEYDITDILFDDLQNAPKKPKVLTAKLAAILCNNSAKIAEHFYYTFDFFRFYIEDTSCTIYVTKIISSFFKFSIKTVNAAINSEFIFNILPKLEDADEGLLLETIDMLNSFVQTKNAFPEEISVNKVALYELYSDICSYLCSLSKEANSLIECFDDVISGFLCTLATQPEIQDFTTVLSPKMISFLSKRLSNLETILKYTDVFLILSENNSDLALYVLRETTLILQISRTALNNPQIWIQIMPIYKNYILISNEIAKELLEGGYLDFLKEEKEVIDIIENEDHEVDLTSSSFTSFPRLDFFDSTQKRVYIELLLAICFMLPDVMREDSLSDIVINEAIILLESENEEFCTNALHAILSLLQAGYLKERIEYEDDFADKLLVLSDEAESEELHELALEVYYKGLKRK